VFAVNIMSNTCTPTSDVAMKLADYVLENYIDVDSKLTKFPSRLWAQPPDVSRAILHGNNSLS